MIFDSLDKLKWNSIFTAILLTAIGVVILILPETLIPSVILFTGYTLIISALVTMMDFFAGKKNLMGYLSFVFALVAFIVGIAVLVFKNDIMVVLARLFGIILVCDGGRTMFHAFAYARRSERKDWWVLAVLSGLLIIVGIGLFINPFFNTPYLLMKAVGSAICFSAIVSALRLVWTWPVKKG